MTRSRPDQTLVCGRRIEVTEFERQQHALDRQEDLVVHQFDPVDRAAQRGVDRDRPAGSVLGRDVHPVEALGQGLAALVPPVPGDSVAAGVARTLAGRNQAAGLVVDTDRDRARRLVQLIVDLRRRRAVETHRLTRRLDLGAEVVEALADLVAADQGQQLPERVVGLDRLLDRAELDELRGELVGVHRRERVLVLELGGQELQEAVEVVREADLALGGTARGRGGGGACGARGGGLHG